MSKANVTRSVQSCQRKSKVQFGKKIKQNLKKKKLQSRPIFKVKNLVPECNIWFLHYFHWPGNSSWWQTDTEKLQKSTKSKLVRRSLCMQCTGWMLFCPWLPTKSNHISKFWTYVLYCCLVVVTLDGSSKWRKGRNLCAVTRAELRNVNSFTWSKTLEQNFAPRKASESRQTWKYKPANIFYRDISLISVTFCNYTQESPIC